MPLLFSMKSIVFSRWLFVFAVNWKHSRGFSMPLTRILRTAVLKLCAQHLKNIRSPCFHSSKVSRRLAVENRHSPVMSCASALETGGERIQDIPSGSVDTSESQWILRSFGHLVRSSTEVIEHFFFSSICQIFPSSVIKIWLKQNLFFSNSGTSNHRDCWQDRKRWECSCEVPSDTKTTPALPFPSVSTRTRIERYQHMLACHSIRDDLPASTKLDGRKHSTLSRDRCRLYHRRVCFPTTILEVPSLEMCRLSIDSFL